jgi:Ca-activated chloride channel family protein
MKVALRSVAELTGGTYSKAGDRPNCRRSIHGWMKSKRERWKTISHRPRRDLFFWPLAAALLVSLGCCALATRRASRQIHAPLPYATTLRVNP